MIFLRAEIAAPEHSFYGSRRAVSPEESGEAGRAAGGEENEKVNRGDVMQRLEAFNSELRNKAFYFIGRGPGNRFAAGGDPVVSVTVGGMIEGCGNRECCSEGIKRLAESVFPGSAIISVEETTFKKINALLKSSFCEGFDREEILRRFDLDRLSNLRRTEGLFEEIMIDEADEETFYEECALTGAGETLIPEIDRIRMGRKEEVAAGHPVHYVVESDDPETQEKVCRKLFQALFACGRISSRRCCRIDIDPDGGPGAFAPDVHAALYKSCSGGAVAVRIGAGEKGGGGDCAQCREAVENIAGVMKAFRNRVLTVLCIPGGRGSLKELIYRSLGGLSTVEIREDLLAAEPAREYLKGLAEKRSVSYDERLTAAVAENERYLTRTLDDMFDEWFDLKLKTSVYPQYKDVDKARKEPAVGTGSGSAYNELMGLVGIFEAKKLIRDALGFFKAQKLFAEKGMTQERPSMHMVFTGNPGTAKTTAARLFAQIMKDNGLLSGGAFVEVGRADLVGMFVGHTAPLVRRQFKKASGGVLFIDEAYSLADDREGLYGDEAVNTIVQEMENRRNDVVVIFAGYPDKMERFLDRNPGLRSRIAFSVPFADYGTDELIDITKLIAGKNGLTFDGGACEKLKTVFEIARRGPNFGNGRYARNVVEKARMSQAARLCEKDCDSVTLKDLSTIIAEDIELPAEAPRQRSGADPIGFAV